MISELKDIQYNVNPEIMESIEKNMLKSSLISKEQREKSMLELFQVFIQRLSYNSLLLKILILIHFFTFIYTNYFPSIISFIKLPAFITISGSL